MVRNMYYKEKKVMSHPTIHHNQYLTKLFYLSILFIHLIILHLIIMLFKVFPLFILSHYPITLFHSLSHFK